MEDKNDHVSPVLSEDGTKCLFNDAGSEKVLGREASDAEMRTIDSEDHIAKMERKVQKALNNGKVHKLRQYHDEAWGPRDPRYTR